MRGCDFLRTAPANGALPLLFHRIIMEQRIAALALAAGLLTACGGGGTDQEKPAEKGPDLVIGGDDASAKANSIYQMPTPNELFDIVQQLAGAGQKRSMSPAPNVDRYVTLQARSLNFGVYATDMVYASNFRITSEVVRYYLACKKLGDQLGLAAAFNDIDFVRLDKNLTHGDSLQVISNGAYYKVYEKMQDEHMGNTLALVLAGGWIESMHLVIKQVTKFDAGDPLIARIAEQNVSLEHLIDLMEQYKDDANVSAMRTKLMAIRDIYDQLNVKRTPHTGPSSSGRMVLGDDVNVALTQEKYDELEKAVETLRDEITRPEDQVAVKPNAR